MGFRPTGGSGWGARSARLLVVLLSTSASAAAQLPAAAGERWHHAAPVFAPHLPQTIAGGGDGEWFAAGLSQANAGLALFGGQGEGGVGLIALDPWCAGASGPVHVATRADRIFSLAQFPLGGGPKRTELAMHRVGGASSSFGAIERYVVGPPVSGRALIAVGTGDTFLVALHDVGAGLVRLSFRRASDAGELHTASLAAPALRALVCDDAAQRFALALGDRVVVLRADASTAFTAPLDFASDALAISGDGSTLAVGASARVRILRETPGGFTESAGPTAAPLELPTALALDRTGHWLAVGWWDAVTGRRVRMETHDLAAGIRVHVHSQGPGALGKQDLVTAARVTADGRRAAFASWGQGGAEPEILVFDRASPHPLLAVDLPGSAFAIALDRSGTRVAVAHKATHANDLAGSGSVRLYDTAERDIELDTSLAGGATSAISCHAPLAIGAWLLVGAKSATPLTVPGFEGALVLDPAAWWTAVPMAHLSDGKFRASLAIPAAATLAGVHVTLQGLAFDGAFRFSAAAPRLPIF